VKRICCILLAGFFLMAPVIAQAAPSQGPCTIFECWLGTLWNWAQGVVAVAGADGGTQDPNGHTVSVGGKVVGVATVSVRTLHRYVEGR
jgi:hypothetical protein